MLSIARALVTMISGGSITMVDYDGALKQIFGLRPWILIIAIVAFIIVFLIEKYTLFGRYTRLVGGEENVACLLYTSSWMSIYPKIIRLLCSMMIHSIEYAQKAGR